MNQLGLGTTVTGEITRPRLHAWFESASHGGILGEEEGAGVEFVYAGGMHTLAIDELGRVCFWLLVVIMIAFAEALFLGLVVGSQ